MNRREEKSRIYIVLTITFALLILFLVMILVSALFTPDKIKERNKIIVKQMLVALNRNITDENEKANKLISFSYDDNAFYITGRNDDRMFFYTYNSGEVHINSVLTSFYKEEETYLNASELIYVDISNEQYEKEVATKYISLTSKSLDDKYHIAMLIQNNKGASYTAITHYETSDLTIDINLSSYPTYTQSNDKNVFDLLNYIFYL